MEVVLLRGRPTLLRGTGKEQCAKCFDQLEVVRRVRAGRAVQFAIRSELLQTEFTDSLQQHEALLSVGAFVEVYETLVQKGRQPVEHHQRAVSPRFERAYCFSGVERAPARKDC